MEIVHSILITISAFFLYKIYGKKSLLLLPLAIFLYPIIMPTYNSFIYILIVSLIFLELSKIKCKDFLIGLLVMIAILTKQSIGIFFIIPTVLLKIFKKEKIKYRLLGFIVPLIPLGLYLYKTHSVRNFIDQCFLGLISFSGNASNKSILAILIFILLLFLSYKVIKKNKHDYTNYYILGAYSIFIPTFDLLHLVYVIFLFFMLVINNYEIKGINIKKTLIITLVLFYGYHFVHIVLNFDSYPTNINHFQYKYVEKDKLDYLRPVIEYVGKNDVVIYDDNSYVYRIANNQKITYLDIVNHGNHGYDSPSKIIKELEKNKDKKLLMRDNTGFRIEYKGTQLDKKGYDYIIDNYNKVDEILNFNIYERK